MLAVMSATVCRYGLRTKSQVSLREGRGKERTGNPPLTDTSTGREREMGGEGRGWEGDGRRWEGRGGEGRGERWEEMGGEKEW